MRNRGLRRYLPRPWRSYFYWANAGSVVGFNREFRNRRTEVMLLVSFGECGIALIRTRPRPYTGSLDTEGRG